MCQPCIFQSFFGPDQLHPVQLLRVLTAGLLQLVQLVQGKLQGHHWQRLSDTRIGGCCLAELCIVKESKMILQIRSLDSPCKYELHEARGLIQTLLLSTKIQSSTATSCDGIHATIYMQCHSQCPLCLQQGVMTYTLHACCEYGADSFVIMPYGLPWLARTP